MFWKPAGNGQPRLQPSDPERSVTLNLIFAGFEIRRTQFTRRKLKRITGNGETCTISRLVQRCNGSTKLSNKPELSCKMCCWWTNSCWENQWILKKHCQTKSCWTCFIKHETSRYHKWLGFPISSPVKGRPGRLSRPRNTPHHPTVAERAPWRSRFPRLSHPHWRSEVEQ